MNEELSAALTNFMSALEFTFREDWEYGQQVMGVERWAQCRDFLERNAYHDWNSHDGLIAAYQHLKKLMQEAGIYREI